MKKPLDFLAPSIENDGNFKPVKAALFAAIPATLIASLGDLGWGNRGDAAFCAVAILATFTYVTIRNQPRGKIPVRQIIEIERGHRLLIRIAEEQTKVEIFGIDCPEPTQKGHEFVKNWLLDYIKDKFITLHYEQPPQYKSGVMPPREKKRTITLYADGINVGLEMLMQGYAFLNDKYHLPAEYHHAFALGKERGIHRFNEVAPALHRTKAIAKDDIKIKQTEQFSGVTQTWREERAS